MAEELQKYRDLDPDRLEELKQQTEVAKQAANRWTDNYFQVRDFAVGKSGYPAADIDKAFGVPADYDYLL